LDGLRDYWKMESVDEHAAAAALWTPLATVDMLAEDRIRHGSDY